MQYCWEGKDSGDPNTGLQKSGFFKIPNFFKSSIQSVIRLSSHVIKRTTCLDTGMVFRCYWVSGLILRSWLEFQTLVDQTSLSHSKTGLVWYLNPHYIYKVQVYQKNR